MRREMSEARLKPCPFCGGRAELTEDRYAYSGAPFKVECAPAPWTSEANALGEMVLTCHDTDADGKPWREDFAQSWGATSEADAKAFCPLPALYGAARRAHAFLAHSSLIGAAEVRAELEAALAKAGGEE